MHTSEFLADVDKEVKEQYGLDDGRDLCFNLIQSGVIQIDEGVKNAARIVAQHLLQA